MNEERKPPTTLYEWMRDRYLERQEKLKKEAQEAKTKTKPPTTPS